MSASKNYVNDFLPPAIVEKLEAGAFRTVCQHLRERNDQVQNIDLMTISGFCRNCLAKWLVVEARKLADDLRTPAGKVQVPSQDLDDVLLSLDALGYEEAAKYVYGMSYDDWKKRYSMKASDETMQKFNESKLLWAKHDKETLAKRSEAPSAARLGSSVEGVVAAAPESAVPSFLSNVCCQDVDEDRNMPGIAQAPSKIKRARELPPYQPPPPPEISISMGILTVSDRASRGQYKTGDLSGPAVKEAVEGAVSGYGGKVKLEHVLTDMVPDDTEAIQAKLKEWADNAHVPLIITTGGTGFGVRDVTPEATNAIVDKSCEGLVTFCAMECAKVQPLASLSRGTAGVRGKSLIVNLPGNPKGVHEILPILFPLALHAVKSLC